MSMMGHEVTGAVKRKGACRRARPVARGPWGARAPVHALTALHEEDEACGPHDVKCVDFGLGRGHLSLERGDRGRLGGHGALKRGELGSGRRRHCVWKSQEWTVGAA
jgi:hypothetical protein